MGGWAEAVLKGRLVALRKLGAWPESQVLNPPPSGASRYGLEVAGAVVCQPGRAAVGSNVGQTGRARGAMSGDQRSAGTSDNCLRISRES